MTNMSREKRDRLGGFEKILGLDIEANSK